MSIRSVFYNEYDIKRKEKYVLWSMRSFQILHQTFHDHCLEKFGHLQKKIGPLVQPDMSGKYGTSFASLLSIPSSL